MTDTRTRGGSRRRIGTAAAVAGRELLRDPVLVVLLVFLPVYFIGIWGWMVPDDPIEVAAATGDGTAVVATDFLSLLLALVAPVTGALLVGIAGLFVVQRSQAVDERLHVVGFRGPELLVARLAALAGITVVVVPVSLAATAVHVTPEHVGWFLLALALAAATYGAVGVLAGLVLDRIAGVYLLLFAPMLDILLLGMPLAETEPWTSWLPGHHATELAVSAALGDSVAIEHAGWGLVVVLILGTVAVLASIRR